MHAILHKTPPFQKFKTVKQNKHVTNYNFQCCYEGDVLPVTRMILTVQLDLHCCQGLQPQIQLQQIQYSYLETPIYIPTIWKERRYNISLREIFDKCFEVKSPILSGTRYEEQTAV